MVNIFGTKSSGQVPYDPGGAGDHPHMKPVHRPTIQATVPNYRPISVSRSPTPRASTPTPPPSPTIPERLRTLPVGPTRGRGRGKKPLEVTQKPPSTTKKPPSAIKKPSSAIKKRKASRVKPGTKIAYDYEAERAPIFKGIEYGGEKVTADEFATQEVEHYQKCTGLIIPRVFMLRMVKKFMANIRNPKDGALMIQAAALDALHREVEELATNIFISTCIMSRHRGASTSEPGDLISAFGIARALGPYQMLLKEHKFLDELKFSDEQVG